jgi:serine/threonine protein kinase/tetratricopeptide (TPR) repeat protein
MIDKTISHYKIIEKIGSGGMGIVYKAQDQKLDRFVALKFLPPHLTTSEDEKQRFIHEAKAASSLDHNNICNIYEIDETEDGQLFISMACYEGETLDNKIKDKPLPIDEAIDISIQIAQGLAKAHEKGIVHRDIKPANIMLTDDNVVKILDFGLAKLSTQTKLTKESTTLGTVSYMSPEQAKGEEVDHRTDIWSLGVILYEMLTGQLPFKGDYESAVIYSIVNETQEPVTALRTGVPMELERIINKCHQKGPGDRYQHVDELIVDLKGLKNESTSIPTKEEEQRKRSKSFLLPVAILSILILIVVGYFLINPGEKSTSGWENSIAVLPFENISNDPEQEYFCDGMTEQIITNLSKLGRLKVIARTSVMKFKNTEKTIPEIGEELDVTHILEGSVRKYGKNIRLTAQLVNTEDGSHLWAEDYNRELNDIFMIQDDISERIANVLSNKLSTKEELLIKTEKPNKIEAYEYYLKGRYFHDENFFGATLSMDDFHKSESYLKKAIDLDPNYALAYAKLADLYNSFFNFIASNDLEKEKYLRLQEEYLNKAYELEPNSAEVQNVKSMIHDAKGEIEKSFESLRKAYTIEPNNWYINHNLGVFYYFCGLKFLSIEYYTKAIKLNPLEPMLYLGRAACFFNIGQKDKAESDFKKALEINPNHIFNLDSYLDILFWSRRYEEAEKIITKLEKINPDTSDFKRYSSLKICMDVLRDTKDIAEVKNLDDDYKYRINTLLENSEEVIQYLNDKFEIDTKLDYSRYIWLNKNPINHFLHNDPRFQEILAKHKELYEENLAKYGDIEELIN